MPVRSSVLRPTPQALLVAAALAAALLVGVLTAERPMLGVGVLAALTLVPLAFVNAPLALSAWVVTALLSGIPGTRGAGSNYVLLIVFVAWLGALAAGHSGVREFAQRQPRLLGAVGAFVAWVAVTLMWAPQPEAGGTETILQLGISVVVFLMVVTLVVRPRHARWLAGAFVAGTALSVMAGAVAGGLDPTAASGDAGRLEGAVRDPNYLAAAIVPAIMLAAGLAARRDHLMARLGLSAVIALLAVGLAATESRGGFVAAAVVLVGAFVVWRQQRWVIAGVTVLAVTAAAMWFAASPASWQRITDVADGGTGRTDVWQVAWQVVQANPLVGTGVAQFPVVSPEFARTSGAIARLDLLVDERIVVHNAYLELWAETGIVGLALFLSIAGASLSAAWHAARRFERAGDHDMTALARAVLLATAGALTASFFLSNADDRRLWVLLACGPALLAIARRFPDEGERPA